MPAQVEIAVGCRRFTVFIGGPQPQHGLEAFEIECGVLGETVPRVGRNRDDFRSDIERHAEPLDGQRDGRHLVCWIEDPAQAFEAGREIGGQEAKMLGQRQQQHIEQHQREADERVLDGMEVVARRAAAHPDVWGLAVATPAEAETLARLDLGRPVLLLTPPAPEEVGPLADLGVRLPVGTLAEVVRPIPAIALVPVAILVLPTDEAGMVFITFEV